MTLFLTFIFSCKKEDTDYRDVYLGIWNFNVERTLFYTDSLYIYHDSVYYEGEIVYGELDNEILIKYTNENSITLTIGQDGELSDFPTNYCSGEFVTIDSLHLFLAWGGLTKGTTHMIEGLKK